MKVLQLSVFAAFSALSVIGKHNVECFVSSHLPKHLPERNGKYLDHSGQNQHPGWYPIRTCHSDFARKSILRRSGPNKNVDGTGSRGSILLGVSLLFTLWLFSIPPEFRRAHVCTLDVCVQNRASCNDCQTLGELREGIASYYKNGGGVEFDFTIDPKTIVENRQALKEKFGIENLI
jgi:hypothetical protein